MSRSNNNEMPRIALEEYELYKKLLEARETQAPPNYNIASPDDVPTTSPSHTTINKTPGEQSNAE
ncbi:hypothetical protein RhiJN_12012 [Ceratobasidium sp. AG-Ba]|nr:hypothetical protein RhiJN_12012 [Ceratobasidium sp. AG-Ba]